MHFVKDDTWHLFVVKSFYWKLFEKALMMAHVKSQLVAYVKF